MSNYAIAIIVSLFSSIFVPANVGDDDPYKRKKGYTSDALNLSYTVPVDSPPSHVPGPGDPTTNQQGSFNLGSPSNQQTIFELDEDGNGLNIYEQIGGQNIRPPSYISLEDYRAYRENQSISDYWKSKQATGGDAQNPAGLAFSIPVNDPKLNELFGSSAVDIRPNGTALLEFSVDANRMKNPSLPLRQQRTVNFNFDQQIQLNVVGKIGDKLRLNANWDTEATFDFENQFKIQYNGSEDEILQTIEAGNVSLPLRGSLIQGGQNLFGIKVAMKFGPLLVTSIASQQKGKTQSVNVEGGSQVTEFEKKANDYDENRHFFLGHHFRSRYNVALENLPNINSAYRITRIEVWRTNTNNASIVNNRNAVGFLDLGEQEIQTLGDGGQGDVFNPGFQNANAPYYPDNNVNGLYSAITSDPQFRSKNSVDSALANLNLPGGNPIVNGVDYEKVENMQLLRENDDFSLNAQLGYISLNQQLQPNQVLFVSYQYQVAGQTFQVGEFTQDKPVEQNEILFLKMLKPSSVQPTYDDEPYPAWDLMMKNIYNINGYGLRPDNFEFNIFYQSPTSAGDLNVLPSGAVKNVPLLQVFNLDQLTNNSTGSPDNQFDFIEGVTIRADRGLIIFPVLEPFGAHLVDKLESNPEDSATYAFPQLYRKTKMDAQQLHQDVDRYVFKGEYKSASSSEISLNAINITPGSVTVTANGMTLQEGSDYTVDYQIGKVRILNQGLLTSGQQIRVNFETNTLFGIESKTLVGSRFDLNLSKDVQLGATFLHLNERPLTNKINIGDEPLSNTMLGVDGTIRKDSRWLTKMVDKLPLLQTKEVSNFTGAAEFAALLPGHPNAIEVEDENGNIEKGIAYLDDFESAKTPFDLSGNRTWFLASFPGDNGNNDLYDPTQFSSSPLAKGYSRAKLAWYSIDPNFYYQSSGNDIPSDELFNHYVRQVSPQELFPKKDVVVGDNILRTLDFFYQPQKRGPYNFMLDDNKLTQFGDFTTPEENWAGVMRKTSSSTDFEASNYEFIEFWLMDPFMYDPQDPTKSNATNDGVVYLNLGKVSEDVLPDGGRAVENGLPENGDYSVVDTTTWGLVPKTPPPTPAFSNNQEARQFQDVGLDGVPNDQEADFYKSYVDSMLILNQTGKINQGGLDPVLADPAGDNYVYFRGQDFDDNRTGILERYINFTNTEGNTPVGDEATENGFSTQGSANPDTEDLNGDLTLGQTERYWEYKIPLSKNDLENLKGFAVDKRVASVDLNNGKAPEDVSWYQFRIPLSAGTPINNITNFKSIDFIRMYMAGFEEPVVLRFAKYQLVSTNWRTFKGYLGDDNEQVIVDPDEPLPNFSIGVVNIEENSEKYPFPYVVPPNVQRQRIVGGIQQQGVQQNEQAMVLKACNLADGDGRGAFKLLPQRFDLRSYKDVKMWIHVEPGVSADPVASNFQNIGDATAFLRLGTDNSENYYEYEIPLTPADQGLYGSDAPTDVWMQDNQFDFSMSLLNLAKAARNDTMISTNKPELISTRFAFNVPGTNGHKIYVVGTPKLSEVRTMMVGLRNPDDGQGPLCLEMWANELRVVNFNETPGWAATGRMNVKLADFGTVSVSGSRRTPGFGSIEQRINARSREDVTQYDLAANLQLGKFFPKDWGVELPLYVTYGERMVNPQFNPLESDVETDDYLLLFEGDPNEQQKRREALQSYQRNRSISLNNIRKTRTQPTSKGPRNIRRPGEKEEEKDKKEKKPRFWDIENFALSLSVSEVFSRDHQTEERWNINHRAAVKYSFNFKPKLIQPFKKWKKKNPISSFNFYLGPKSIAVDVTGNRRYEFNQIRATANQAPIDPTYFRDFRITRNYRLRWDFTRSLSLNFNATNQGRVDEPLREVTTANQDSIWQNLLSFGRETRTIRPDSLGYYLQGKDKMVNFGRNTGYNHSATLNYVLPFDQWKLTNWISGTVSYNGAFNWKAGPDNLPTIGNTIGNTRGVQGNLRLNMDNFYNKIPGLKKFVQPQQQRGGRRTVRGVPQRETKKEEEAKQDSTDSDPFIFLKKAGIEVLKILTSVKNVDVTYGLNNSTVLPGYMPNTDNFGLDFNHYYSEVAPSSTDTFFVKAGRVPPGMDFIAGWQVHRDSLLSRGTRDGWLSKDPALSASFTQNMNEQLTGRTSLTLFKDLKIDLNVTKSASENFTSLIRYNDTLGQHVLDNQLLTGQYQLSYVFFGTAFENNSVDNNVSQAFEEFSNNRFEISRRLYQENQVLIDADTSGGGREVQGFRNGYTGNSQDVLIPAFLAAYGPGTDQTVGLTAFPKIPLPNWTINWNGLGKLPGLKNVFSSVTVRHSYRGSYSVSNYTSNLNFEEIGSSGFSREKNFLLGDSIFNYQPDNVIQSVSMTESFAPLIGINMSWKNGLSTSLDYKMSRNIGFNVGNAQVNETRTQDISVAVSWRKDKLNAQMRLFGKDVQLKNSLNARLECTIRDRKTRNRRLDSNESQGLTGGNFSFILKPTVDYTVNQRLNIMFFVEQNINRPYISTSFPTSFTSVGFRVRFTLN